MALQATLADSKLNPITQPYNSTMEALVKSKQEISKSNSQHVEALARVAPEVRVRLVTELLQSNRAILAASPIRRFPRGGGLPCSFAQQRLWLMDQIVGDSPLYNVPVALRIRGKLDIEALECAFTEVIARHEILRTVFREESSGPAQIPLPQEPFRFERVDLCKGGSASGELERLMNEEARRPFCLRTGPVLRATLFHCGIEEHVLLLVMHHIVCDAWSVDVLARELEALYDAFRQNRPSPLPDLPVQYGDFACWQRRRMEEGALRPHLEYWRERLRGASGVLPLHFDYPRPAVSRHRGALDLFLITEPTLSSLREFARAEGVTLFVVAMAALKILLFRYTGQRDLCVGTPVAGREHSQIENLIGFFVNSVPLRSELDGAMSVQGTLRQVLKSFTEAYEHSSVPFDVLVKELHPERDISYNPIFQVMLVLLNASAEQLHWRGLEIERIRLDHGVSKFDVTIYLREDEDRLFGEVEYNTDLFNVSTIRRMTEHFQRLLGAMIENPESRIEDLKLLTDAEAQALSVDWNRTEWAFPKDATLNELFERQAASRPNATAVIFEGKELSYSKVSEWSDAFAARLCDLGAGPDRRVGILLDRSPEAIIAILAVLKAGAAYVPLDPKYPAERLRYMMRDSRAQLLITTDALSHLAPEDGVGVRVLMEENAEIPPPADAPSTISTAQNTAYVIYTSGSTGQPKGVVLDHQGRVNNILDINTRFAVNPSDRLLSLSACGFDMFVYDVFGMLLSGGAVVLPSPSRVLDVGLWLDLIAKYEITVWNSAPVLLEMLVDELDRRPGVVLPSLRLALLGGDWIPVRLPDRIRSRAPNLRVVSLGGATEASIHSTIFPIKSTDPDWQTIPYGKPMANQAAYVLDGRYHLCPIGAPGELYLAGVGLASCYFDRPDLTAERFLPNPYANPGDRIYHTGDIARWSADGKLELIGRADQQVKVRGFRIELGEIVAALRRQDGIKEAIVLAAGDTASSRRLVAYIAPSCRPAPSVAAIRDQLRTELPDYMTPAEFVILDNLPLTPNGKVDRRALMDIKPVEVADGPSSALPRTALETLVVRIVGEVLGTPVTAMDVDLFDVGAHSLLIVQIVSRLREILEVEIPIRSVFEHPTAAGIADVLERIAENEGRIEEIEVICDAFMEVDALTEERARELAGEAGTERL